MEGREERRVERDRGAGGGMEESRYAGGGGIFTRPETRAKTQLGSEAGSRAELGGVRWRGGVAWGGE